MSVVLTLVQVSLCIDLTAGVFSQDSTGDIVCDTHGSAETATGKLFTFTLGEGRATFKPSYWFINGPK